MWPIPDAMRDALLRWLLVRVAIGAAVAVVAVFMLWY